MPDCVKDCKRFYRDDEEGLRRCIEKCRMLEGVGPAQPQRPSRLSKAAEVLGYILAIPVLIGIIIAWGAFMYLIYSPLSTPTPTTTTIIVDTATFTPNITTTSTVWSPPPLNQAKPSVIIDINSTWVTQFINYVNQYRVQLGNQPLQYCPTLSLFAEMRFETMVNGTNWQISHYGFTQDLQKFEAMYGLNSSFGAGEEVLYPTVTLYPSGVSENYTPGIYVVYLKNYAPIHWLVLMTPFASYYGYYIGNGPTVTLTSLCPATEIPGPGINITQFDLEHNCSVTYMNSTWLVIELANMCPG